MTPEDKSLFRKARDMSTLVLRLTFVLILSTNVLNMRTNVDALGNLIFGQTRGRILALLFDHPDQARFVREISRKTGTSAGTVQRELEALFQVGLLERSTSGRQVYYKPNRNHPVFPEIQSLASKTIGIFAVLRSALVPLAQRIQIAFVYGSVARRSENAASDIDLMIVGDAELDEVLDCLTPAERSLGRVIHPVVYSENEFTSKLQGGNHFLRSVMLGEKVPLVGDPDELAKVGRVRMAASSADEP